MIKFVMLALLVLAWGCTSPSPPLPELPTAFDSFESMVTHPAMQEILRSTARLSLDERYDPLIKSFHMSRAQAKRCKRLLLDRQMAMMDFELALFAVGQAPDAREAKSKEMIAGKKGFDDRLRKLLGDRNYEALEWFDATEWERVEVDRFKSSLASTSEPLTEEQERELARAMYKARIDTSPPGTVPNPSDFTYEGMIRALEEVKQVQARYELSVQGILSPAQFEEFKKFVAR